MKRFALLVAAIITTALVVPHAQVSDTQDTRLRVGGIEVALGMREEDVLRRLSAIYDLRDGPEEGGWMVVRRGGPPFDFIGHVSFRDGRLYFASKLSVDNNQTAHGLSLALYEAVRGLAGGSGRPCVISAEPQGPSLFQTKIQCGRHQLTVTGSHDAKVAAAVNESVR